MNVAPNIDIEGQYNYFNSKHICVCIYVLQAALCDCCCTLTTTTAGNTAR